MFPFNIFADLPRHLSEELPPRCSTPVTSASTKSFRTAMLRRMDSGTTKIRANGSWC